jgi:hypothetical protein
VAWGALVRSAREAQRELRSADLKKVVVGIKKIVVQPATPTMCFCLENVHENGKRWVRRPAISLDAYLDRQKIDTA